MTFWLFAQTSVNVAPAIRDDLRTLVQQAAGLSSLQSGLLTVGYLVGVLATIRVGERLLRRMGPRKPMLLGCWITGAGILLTTLTFLLSI